MECCLFSDCGKHFVVINLWKYLQIVLCHNIFVYSFSCSRTQSTLWCDLLLYYMIHSGCPCSCFEWTDEKRIRRNNKWIRMMDFTQTVLFEYSNRPWLKIRQNTQFKCFLWFTFSAQNMIFQDVDLAFWSSIFSDVWKIIKCRILHCRYEFFLNQPLGWISERIRGEENDLATAIYQMRLIVKLNFDMIFYFTN